MVLFGGWTWLFVGKAQSTTRDLYGDDMSAEIWGVIVGGLFVIMAALILVMVRVVWRRKERRDSRQDMQRSRGAQTPREGGYFWGGEGGIERPRPNEAVGGWIACSGWVRGVKPGMHLWLAVGIGRLMWPKEAEEGEVVVDEENRWQASVSEGDRPGRFSLALMVADSEGDETVRQWLETGRRTDHYPGLGDVRGARCIARVDGLRLVE
jgi:hypothetical protein